MKFKQNLVSGDNDLSEIDIAFGKKEGYLSLFIKLLLLPSLLLPVLFGHVELPFVFGLVKGFGTYSKDYVLSIPFIKSILAFDIILFSPLLLCSGVVFIILKGKRVKERDICSFYIAFLYTFLFIVGIYHKDPPVSFGILFAFSIFVFFTLYRLLGKFLVRNFLTGLITSSVILFMFFFTAVCDGAVGFTLDFAALFFLLPILVFLTSRSCFKKTLKYFVSLVFFLILMEWYIFVQFSSSALYFSNTKYKASTAKPNVVLIVLDTFRADYCDTKKGGKTPALASFAEDSVVYKNCSSTSSWTLPGHASIFTGLYPSSHGAHHIPQTSRNFILSPKEKRKRNYHLFSEENLTLAEILRKNNYKTYGVVANYGYMHHTTGIAQGFQYYDDRRIRPFFRSPMAENLLFIPKLSAYIKPIMKLSGFYEYMLHHQYRIKHYRIAEDVNSAVINILENGLKEPFLLFVNYMDTHNPYTPVRKYREMFPDKIKDKWLFEKDGPGKKELMSGERGLTKAEKEHTKSAYQAEVMYVSEQIGLLFTKLKEKKLYDNSLIILTSDHGEFLGEHGLMGHECGLYNEVTSVPLIIKYPRKHKTGTESKHVQLVDILPIILDVLRIQRPSYLSDSKASRKEIVSEQYDYFALVREYSERFRGITRSITRFPFKYIYNSKYEDELYDLRYSPDEKNNIIKKKPRTAELMKAALENWLNNRKKPPKSKTKRRGIGEMNRLKSLGYL